jgi:hypothetical protein
MIVRDLVDLADRRRDALMALMPHWTSLTEET